MVIRGHRSRESSDPRTAVFTLTVDARASVAAEWRYGVAVKEMMHLARDGQGPHLNLGERVGMVSVENEHVRMAEMEDHEMTVCATRILEQQSMNSPAWIV